MTKRCAKCGAEKSLDGFRRDRRKKDGRGSQCRDCANAWQREFMAKFKAETGQHYRYVYQYDHTCEACGKTWTSRDHGTRFCSGTCANSARRFLKNCEVCGVEWTAKRSDARHCSPDCNMTALRASRSQVAIYTGPRPPRVFAPVVLPPLRKRWYAGRCSECGESFVHDQPQTRTCSQKCQRRMCKQRRRAVQKGAFVANVSRVAIYERDSWICQLCDGPVDREATAPSPLAPSIDHIIPLASGGTHEPSNVQCAHFLCNCLKGAGTGLPVAA